MKLLISPPHREKNGRKRRQSTKAEIEDAQRAAEEREKAVVLAQPHRRGNSDQKCGWPLGEFAIAHRADLGWDEALYHAGCEYSGLVRRWRLAKGLPDPSAGRGGARGVDVDPEVIIRLESLWQDAEASVRYWGGDRAYVAARALCVDHEHLPVEAWRDAMRGLRLLAKHFGML